MRYPSVLMALFLGDSYYVNNENKILTIQGLTIRQMQDEYGIDIETKGLNELVEMTSSHPRNINATLILDRDAVVSFTENSLASTKS